MQKTIMVLKMRLLLEALDQVPEAEVHVLIIAEAETAYAEALRYGFPFLLFPCLFAERTRLALESETQRQNQYWRRMTADWDFTRQMEEPAPRDRHEPIAM